MNIDPYKAAGINYAAMDPFKRACMLAADTTIQGLDRLRIKEIQESRGESAYVIRGPSGDHLALVIEGLGTKSLVADAMFGLTGLVFDDRVAQCNVAMVLNDLATVGADPAVFMLKVDAGDDTWFNNDARTSAFINSTAAACCKVGCAWGGGETATLPGIVEPGATVFSGSAVGTFANERHILRGTDIEAGNAIVLFGSSGPHANGLSLCRKVSELLPEGYLTPLPDGLAYGEALLAPTYLYAPVMYSLRQNGIRIRYAVNITGHGWRKLMRAVPPFAYVIEQIPDPHLVFRMIQDNGRNQDGSVGLSDEHMYGTFNMGAGFALIVDAVDAQCVADIAIDLGISAIVAGQVQKGDKCVEIRPKNIRFAAETLAVR